jgi:hypothetical protein
MTPTVRARDRDRPSLPRRLVSDNRRCSDERADDADDTILRQGHGRTRPKTSDTWDAADRRVEARTTV